MDNQIGTALIVSIICFLFSYLIGYKKMLFLVIGYKDELFLGDKNKLGKRIGTIAFLLGVMTLLLPLGLTWFGSVAFSVYGLISLVLVALTICLYQLPYFNVK
ncbi:hypothetical protein NQ129_12145 [Priestia aryabhattai]|uniref:hypothetical protein n=1 Tax=Priestia aryabhattai TaxID=412384 RepID=UPI00211C5448|nr:hypothetical protein [Priestia aryabhattai]MCQ9282530.1 hypothetical protein [Priestia aryabhattai]